MAVHQFKTFSFALLIASTVYCDYAFYQPLRLMDSNYLKHILVLSTYIIKKLIYIPFGHVCRDMLIFRYDVGNTLRSFAVKHGFFYKLFGDL